MKARVIEAFPTRKGMLSKGQIIEIPPALLEKLKGKVEPISEPKAWLTEKGELRTQGVFDDLAAEIVRLTKDNLLLQRQLLTRHCGEFDQQHIGHLWEAWEERVAIMEHDGGLSRREAEYEAAERLHLLAFMDIRADARSGN
ncbi:MAG: hypothetical protein HXX11_06110 [Desulfuromonadales bacterium]|nr:hypothetical protein [Desulfuromonadales bacterium]